MDSKYITNIALHVGFGILLYFVGIFPKIYFFGVVGFFLFKIVTAHPKQRTTMVLMGCAYLTGAEVIFRMTDAGLFYESSKYFIILYIIVGMFYDGISNRSYPYLIFLLLLLPSIIVAATNIGADSDLRKNIAFVLSGPFCLGISALYCYNKRIKLKEILDILLYLALPIVTLTTYLYLYTPSIKDIITDTESNFAASGGFGPNQVSTVLGLGMFVFCVNFFLNSKSSLLKVINIILFCLVSFRGIITFSRGGVLTAILMIFAFLLIVYAKSNSRQKGIIIGSFLSFIFISFAIWAVSSNQTNGLIDKRYANQDKIGREKKDVSAGRLDLIKGELEGFIEEPFLGVGASGMKERRLQSLGRVIATHNELSRMLSEHGILGIFMLLILIFKPLEMRSLSRSNFFFYAFLIFWFATINHSAMRIAAPGFIYGLALLNIRYEKYSLPRKRLVSKG